MAQRVEHNPLKDAFAALLTQGLDGAGEALRVLVDEVSKIERSRFLFGVTLTGAILSSYDWSKDPGQVRGRTGLSVSRSRIIDTNASSLIPRRGSTLIPLSSIRHAIEGMA